MTFPRQNPSRLLWRLVALFLLLAIGIGAAGYGYLRSELKHTLQEKQNELAAIADLKARQIVAWREERRADAESILATSFVASHAQRWLASGGRDQAEERALRAWMTAPRHSRHYSCVYLFDPSGEMRLASNGAKPVLCEYSHPTVLEAMRTQRVLFLDFHATKQHEKIHLSLFVPLLADVNGKKITIGALAFEIDPQHFLYPLIQSWPTPSPTAETLLVRRDGDSVLYLNELRHRKESAMALRRPLSDTALPAVRAALGEEGNVSGKDYRGVEVLSVLRKIPDSPWSLITKVDRAEVDAPLRERVIMVASVSALLIGLTAVAVILLWRQQQMRFDLARHEFEEETLHKANIELEAHVAERTRELRETAESLQQEIALTHITENILKESMAQLSRSNADLEQFAYIASHDLQEPLRMVASFVQLLARRYHDKLDQDAHDFIGYAVEGVTRMQRLIDDQLTYALVGIDNSQLETVDCNQVLAEVLTNLKPLIEEHHAAITQDVLPGIPLIYSQFSQLLQNLIGNAIKFHGERAPQIHIGARLDDNHWIFSVRDNGIGIAPEYFDKIFLIFKRLHSREKYPGTGIGLAICKRIAERHHGRIWVESELGKGSTFYFTIPTTLEEQQPIS
ncbi:MAG: ATP-binding protein [Sulfuricella sp.]|nr:ATP-binding protein [Sulfuricella sp.]